MLNWRSGGDWLVFLGGVYIYQQVDVLETMPLAGIQWRTPASLGWSVRLGVPATSIRYRLNGHWAADLDFISPPAGVFRLRDDSPVIPAGYVSAKGMGGA